MIGSFPSDFAIHLQTTVLSVLRVLGGACRLILWNIAVPRMEPTSLVLQGTEMVLARSLHNNREMLQRKKSRHTFKYVNIGSVF